jgi:hypothetical protein
MLAAAALATSTMHVQPLGTVTVLRLIDLNRNLQPERREATCGCLCAAAEVPSVAIVRCLYKYTVKTTCWHPPPTQARYLLCVSVCA